MYQIVKNILLVVVLLISQVSAQNKAGDRKLDSLFNQFAGLSKDEIDKDLIESLSQICTNTRTEDCDNFFKVVLGRLSLQNTSLEFFVRNKYIVSLINSKNYHYAKRLITQNLEKTIAANDSMEWSKTLVLSGWLNSLKGNNLEAVENYNKALYIKKSINHTNGVININNRLALLFRNIKDYEKAKEYAFIAVELNKENNFKSRLRSSYAHLAQCYLYQDSMQKAMIYYNKAKDLYGVNGKYADGSFFNYITSEFLLRSGKIEEAEQLFLKYKSIKTKQDKYLEVWRFQIKLIKEYLNTNNYEKAKYHLDDLKSTLPNDGPLNEVLEKQILDLKLKTVSKDYSDLDSLSNDVVNALKNRVSELNISSASNLNLIDERNLLFKELAETKEKNIQKSKRIKNQIYLFLIMALLIGLLAYLFYKNKQEVRRSNKLLEDLKKTNADLNESVEEKSFLLKEIHHRVKNNLQTISSLLNLQTHHVDDTKGNQALQSSMNRVLSIALIHQFLYEKKNVDSVNISKYIQTLVLNLIDIFEIPNASLETTFDIDPILIQIETMNSLGLLINELVNNSLKYAFVNNAKGRLFVSLKEHEDFLRLVIEDNGKGIEESSFQENFGFFLIRTLVDKLDGDIKIENTKGARIQIDIRNYKLKKI